MSREIPPIYSLADASARPRYLRALTELTGLRIRSKREKVLERFPEDLVYRHSKGVAESRNRR